MGFGNERAVTTYGNTRAAMTPKPNSNHLKGNERRENEGQREKNFGREKVRKRLSEGGAGGSGWRGRATDRRRETPERLSRK